MNLWDTEELAWRVIGYSDEDIDDAMEDGGLDEALHMKFGIDFDTFYRIVSELIEFTPLIETAITKEKFHAFVDADKQRAIVKVPAQNVY